MLHHAAHAGADEVCAILVASNNALLDARTDRDESPLQLALLANSKKTVEALLKVS